MTRNFGKIKMTVTSYILKLYLYYYNNIAHGCDSIIKLAQIKIW